MPLPLHLNPHTLTPSYSSHFPSLNKSRIPVGYTHFPVRAVEAQQQATINDREEEKVEEPVVNFSFVHSVLLPDGTPDVHYRTACGGQKLRNIMLDNDMELYGPYSRPLLNCAGGGTCGTCLVEVVEGKELLNPRTDKEKEKLNKNPRTWRLACQTTVGKPDSSGLVVIQQLPEWKAHNWIYSRAPPEGEEVVEI